jgi:hypothetical protein
MNGRTAGYVQISGGFSEARRDEVLSRVRHGETHEKAEHPLERIIAAEQGAGGAPVTTTSGHLARLLGHAPKSAFGDRLSLTYNRDDNLARVRWPHGNARFGHFRVPRSRCDGAQWRLCRIEGRHW